MDMAAEYIAGSVSFLKTINWIALISAIIAPFLVLFSRNEIRLRRLRQLQDFEDRYQLSKDKDKDPERNPTFEFVLSKYTADLILENKSGYVVAVTHQDKLQRMIEAAHSNRVDFSSRLALSSVGFILISYFGFDLLMRAVGCSATVTVVCGQPSQLSTVNRIDNILLVSALAFVGAYISGIRTLLKRLAVFDLSSNTFLRVTLETAASIFLVAVLFAAFPDPLFTVGATLTGKGETVDHSHIPFIWIALAPLLGLMPQSSTKFLMVKLQSLVKWTKTTDDRFVEITPIVSLDVIDGIDYETRFRLEDCGIYDVQNLATYNPILLNIETPFGIYQCIDWIAQAQLCHIVGLERFLILRELNVRTIFDLERAIDSIHSPDEFDDIYASILMAPTNNLRRAAEIGKLQFLISDAKGPRLVTVEEYCKWSRERLSTDLGKVSKSTEHLMAWITDDLHVRRLRRLWNDISDSLDQKSMYFEDSKRNPNNKSVYR